MKIGIIGATGTTGRALHAEAVRRGHDVTAIVRDPAKAADVLGPDARVLERDAFAVDAADLAGFDVVVSAYATTPQDAASHTALTRQLVDRAGDDGPRLVFLLGAGSLTAQDGRLAVEHLREAPGAEHWIAIPEEGVRELEFLRTVDTAEWVGVSPQLELRPGPATTPTLGLDEVLTASDGGSHTTTGTMAVAVLDEIEEPRHRNRRFTVSDA